jgi:hypothetical protein
MGEIKKKDCFKNKCKEINEIYAISKFSLEFRFDINLFLRVAKVIGLVEPDFSSWHVEFSIVISVVVRIVGLIIVGIVASIVLRAWG